MGSINISGGSGFDLSKYIPIDKTDSFNYSVVNGWQDIYNVTGEGFLSQALIIYGYGSTNELQIYVDGVLKYYGLLTAGEGANACAGITTPDFISQNTGNRYVKHSIGNTNFYCSTAGSPSYPQLTQSAGVAVIAMPIFFKTSLVVKFKNTAASAQKYFLKGGLKV